MEKLYTEEDLRQAFYKGREQIIMGDETFFIRPTFNGYLRELDGGEDPEKEWQERKERFDKDMADKPKFCPICRQEYTGNSYLVLDNNNNPINGVKQCQGCFKESIGLDRDVKIDFDSV